MGRTCAGIWATSNEPGLAGKPGEDGEVRPSSGWIALGSLSATSIPVAANSVNLGVGKDRARNGGG